MTKPKYIASAEDMQRFRIRLGYNQEQMGALMSMSRGNYARMECGSYGMRKYHVRLLRVLRVLERAGLLDEFAREIFSEHGV